MKKKYDKQGKASATYINSNSSNSKNNNYSTTKEYEEKE
jgi:hypothetical protein